MSQPSPQQLKEAMSRLETYARSLGKDAADYWEYHKRRFLIAARVLADLLAERQLVTGRKLKILDIGNSFQTLLFCSLFQKADIDTLGFKDSRYDPLVQGGRTRSLHREFDLNDAFYEERWIDGECYDVVTMLEVVEHLYTSPGQVLAFLAQFLGVGGQLLIQTPNAVSLAKRLRMLGGRNPFELIRETRTNPGHFREYTRQEICDLAAAAGFRTIAVMMGDHFADRRRLDRFSTKFSKVLPRDWRSSMTIIFERDGTDRASSRG
jgi:hypothetical protein